MLFGKLGNVEDAEIIYNDKGSKGFGFVTMSRGRDADNALIRLNHSIVEGRIIEVGRVIKLVAFLIYRIFRLILPLPRLMASRGLGFLLVKFPVSPSTSPDPPTLWPPPRL